MPLYEFMCMNCAEEFDKIVSIANRNDEVECPKADVTGCLGPALRREIPSELSVAYSKERGEFFEDNVKSTNSTRGM